MIDDPGFEKLQERIDLSELERLISQRKTIEDLTNKVFWRLNRIEMKGLSIKIIAEDQGGWPFTAISLEFGTGHTLEFFHQVVIGVLERMLAEQ